MADTVRTLAALQALLADNTTGDISPQDLRDLMESLRTGFINIYVSSAASTSIASSGTKVKVAGTTSLVGTPERWSMPANNRIQLDAATTRLVRIAARVTFELDGGSEDDIEFVWAKNGTLITTTAHRTRVESNGEPQFVSIFLLAEADPGDYFEVFVSNEDSSQDVTVNNMTISGQDFLAP